MPQYARLLTGLVFMLTVVQAMAQGPLDSLKQQLTLESSPTARVDLLNQIASGFEHISFDSSARYAKEALQISEEYNLIEGQLKAYTTLVLTYANMGRFEEAKKVGRTALELADEENQPLYFAKVSQQLGRAYGRQGSYQGGVYYFKQGLELNKSLQDSALEAGLYNGLGSMYVFLEEYVLAEEHYKRSMDIYAGLGDTQNLSRLHNNIAGTYYYLGRWEDALEQYQRTLSIYEELGLACLQVVARYNIGGIYLKQNKLKEADHWLNQAFEEGKNCEVGDLKVHMLNDLATLADLQGKNQLAESLYLEAMEVLGVHKNYFTISAVTEKVYQFYNKRHDSANALYYLELHNQAEDSIKKQGSVQKIAQLTSEYEFNKEREALKASQEKAALIMQSELDNERFIRNATILAAFFFILLALSYYRTSRVRKRANASLQQQNGLILVQKQSLLEKTGELSDTNQRLNKLSEYKENLTHMIAHDLKNALNTIMAASRNTENRKMQMIYKSGSNALGLISNMLDVHKFEETDMEVNKEPQSMVAIMYEARMQVFLLLETKKLKLELCHEADVLAAVDQELMLRVLVNLLTNAIKYSDRQGVIRIGLQYEQSSAPQLQLHVQDFGEGIPEKDLPYIFEKHWSSRPKQLENDISTGLGLTFCKMAVEAHKGMIKTESKEGEGTTFCISLPAIKSQPVEERYLSVDQNRRSDPAMDAILKPYAIKIKDMEVHEVSRIKTVLEEVENLKLDTDWHREVEFAMYKGDKVNFKLLINSVLDSDSK